MTDRVPVEFHPFPTGRRFVTGAIRAGRPMALMHGLVTVDVTDARRRLRARQPPLSLTAYVVGCVARAAADHPEVHAYRDWRGRLAVSHGVDVGVLIETHTASGPVPVGHVVRGAHRREIADISAEIRAVQADPGSGSSDRLVRRAAVVGRVPGLTELFFRLARRSVRMHALSGTVAVSSVGGFGGGEGFGIGVPTVLTLSVIVGGLSTQPRVVNGEVRAREVLNLTISVDHKVVDGAPAARFAASLRELLEGARLVPEPGSQRTGQAADAAGFSSS
ncbi:MAG TPA: 2-oxo acid dehydrogenase subunit E2 [Jiangellaceae bacterium]|nr:2-oxo acid dehydrogenase subunit E2 [Jiangellaceae bacterium]